MAAVALNEKAYGMLIEKQGEIYRNYKVRIDLLKIASAAIIRGINDTEEELSLRK